jgi:hypothetical protein
VTGRPESRADDDAERERRERVREVMEFCEEIMER